MLKRWSKSIISASMCILPIALSVNNTYAKDMSPGYIKVEVENISFVGNSGHKVEISLINKSSRAISFRKIKEEFYIQTEVLGQWKKLSNNPDTISTAERITTVQPNGKQTVVTVVKIPPDMPQLYINAYGEINLKLSANISFTVKNQNMVFEQAHESLYWVTPGTNKWQFREGM